MTTNKGNNGSVTPPPPAPLCPECDTQLVLIDGKLPEKCAKCETDLKLFGNYFKLFKTAMKQWTKDQEAEARARKESEDNGDDEDEGSILDHLRRL